MNGPQPPEDDELLQSKASAGHRIPASRGALPEVRIVIIYFVCASTWIIGTDLILTESRIGGTAAGMVQSLKGLNFVITTAVLLYMVLRRSFGGWRRAEQQRLAVIERASEKFRLLSAHVQTLREEERTRISREIHDELGQLLTSIKMELRTVENHLANRDDRELNSMIDKLVEASEMVDGTLDAVRRISSGLRPSALDNLGLGTALMDEAVLFGERSGVACAIVIDTLPEALAPEVVTTTFRIFQECLTNIARHAEARRVDASLKVVENCLRLKVCDDGRGIDPRLVENPQSLGLIGMRERAENVGGKVIFRRNSVKGTEVILTIPLSSAVKPPAQTP